MWVFLRWNSTEGFLTFQLLKEGLLDVISRSLIMSATTNQYYCRFFWFLNAG